MNEITSNSTSKITLNIDGMHCGACVRRVIQALERVPGTTVEEVRIGAARVQAESSEPLVAALAKAGYEARPIADSIENTEQR